MSYYMIEGASGLGNPHPPGGKGSGTPAPWRRPRTHYTPAVPLNGPTGASGRPIPGPRPQVPCCTPQTMALKMPCRHCGSGHRPCCTPHTALLNMPCVPCNTVVGTQGYGDPGDPGDAGGLGPAPAPYHPGHHPHHPILGGAAGGGLGPAGSHPHSRSCCTPFTRARGIPCRYCGHQGQHGFGHINRSNYHGVGAFGDAASSVCADWQAGGNGDNTAGTRAAQAIQNALNAQGYGPIAVDGIFGDASIAAWNQFAAASGATSGWPDCAGITQLMAGGGGGTSKAGMLLGLGLAALVVLGGMALLSKRKGKGAPHHHGHSDTVEVTERRT